MSCGTWGEELVAPALPYITRDIEWVVHNGSGKHVTSPRIKRGSTIDANVIVSMDADKTLDLQIRRPLLAKGNQAVGDLSFTQSFTFLLYTYPHIHKTSI
jgi:hypothetical protein